MITQDRPVYLKIRDYIAAAILEGQYRDGDALPSVRTLAAESGANPLTVAKAYQSFQDDGIVIVRRGVGMFLADGATEQLKISQRDVFLREYWPWLRTLMRQLDIDPQELLAEVDQEPATARQSLIV